MPTLLRYATIARPVGIRGLAVNPITHGVYVGDLASKSITVLDGESYAVLDTIPVVVPGSIQPPSHHAIYAAEPMSYARFAELFAGLPWQRAGRK